MIREHSEVAGLFADPTHRPQPEQIADLIQNGLTEEDLIVAGEVHGYNVPKMSQTLAELDAVIPYIQEVVEDVTEQSSNGRLIFAARDAELLYDFCKIAIPDADAHLLPASSHLWDQASMWRDATPERRETARQFLGRYGLNEATIKDPDRTITLVDTGFYGSVGENLSYAVLHTYDVDLSRGHHLVTKLVCADPEGLGEQITMLPDTEKALDAASLPRTTAWMGDASFPLLYQDRLPNFRLAVILQTMPQYHESFTGIAMREGIAEAVTRLPQTQPCDDIDTPPSAYGSHINPSIVHPLAAAVVQYRVVSAALEARDNQS
ncbi:MAG TPA: hypothetical protein VHT70_03765 [Candidatus Saccharimonadales bacterium]|jgi:hypothetical protein|nr:hypothetical protein [Candidatus Saccharimonadales bacterium]